MRYLGETRILSIQPFHGVEPVFAREVGAAAASMLGLLANVNDSVAVPGAAWNRRRRQYRSDAFLEALAELVQAALPGQVLLGVTKDDLFIPGLNYIFGEADHRRGVSVISLARLEPERGDIAAGLYCERAVKESIHELGHVFGLAHCPEATCIMHFSNTIADTDIKGPDFCARCAALLFQRADKSAVS